jgi:hypothetical protein
VAPNVGIRLLRRIEAVKHLDVLVADEQLLRLCTGDRGEEWRLVALVDASRRGPVGGSDLQGDLLTRGSIAD